MSKRVRRHVNVAGTGIVVALVVYFVLGQTPEVWQEVSFGTKAADTHWKLSVALASAASVLLAATLTVGPIRVLRGGAPAVHLPIRRTLGVWTAVFASAHSVLGVTIHTVGIRVWTPFTVGLDSSGPLDFTVVVWLGLFSLVLLVGLAVISRSVSMRRFGSKRWKALQRSSYAAAFAILGHMLLIQRSEQRISRHIAIALLPFVVVFVMQIAAFVRTRKSSPVTAATFGR